MTSLLVTPLTANRLTLNLLDILLLLGPALTAARLTDHLSDILKPEDRHQLPPEHLPLERVTQAEAEQAILQLGVGHLCQEARVHRNNKQLLLVTDTTAIKVFVRKMKSMIYCFSIYLSFIPIPAILPI